MSAADVGVMLANASIQNAKPLSGVRRFAASAMVLFRAAASRHSGYPLSLAETKYNIVHGSEMPRGGHLAALEQPEPMLADLRAFIAIVSGERP